MNNDYPFDKNSKIFQKFLNKKTAQPAELSCFTDSILQTLSTLIFQKKISLK